MSAAPAIPRIRAKTRGFDDPMHVFFDDRQFNHAPDHYFRLGQDIPHPEQPERARLLCQVMVDLGQTITAPGDFGLQPLYAVHDRAYVDFFRTAWDRWTRETGHDHPAVPNYHTGRRVSRMPESAVGQLGYFSTDTSCPVTAGTWDAIYWSAQCAVEAARKVANGDGPAYALCRPPGHHASKDASNGFCFFNNAAIAAQDLCRTANKVAILDMDTHAGNGTQDIFYDRADVFTASLHTDPANYPPHYAGYADERGTGVGEGYHLNVVLTPGDEEAEILDRFDQMTAAIQAFAPDALVVSLGFDMGADDPLSEVGMTATGFAEMARRMAALGLPTAYIQEGGYLGPSLSDNARAFFEVGVFRR